MPQLFYSPGPLLPYALSDGAAALGDTDGNELTVAEGAEPIVPDPPGEPFDLLDQSGNKLSDENEQQLQVDEGA